MYTAMNAARIRARGSRSNCINDNGLGEQLTRWLAGRSQRWLAELIFFVHCFADGVDQTAASGVRIHSGSWHLTARATLFAHLLNSSTIY